MNIKWRSKLGFIFYIWFKFSGRGVNIKKSQAKTIRSYIEFFAINGLYYKLAPLVAKLKDYDLRKYICACSSLYYQCIGSYLIAKVAKKGIDIYQLAHELDVFLNKQSDRLIEEIKGKLEKKG